MPVSFRRPGGGIGPGRFLSPYPIGDESPTVSSISPVAGSKSGGTAVTIIGTNFNLGGSGDDIIVTFDGTPATNVVVVDHQTITCVTPLMVDTGQIDVTVSVRGRSATLYSGFTSFETVITEITPSHGPLAGGTSVLIAGYNFQLGSTVTFGGEPATNVVFIDTEHIRCTTPSHATGFVDVVVTGP